jgi:hypothetical protein
MNMHRHVAAISAPSITRTDYFMGINFFPEEARPDVFGSNPARPPITGGPILISPPKVDD